MMITFNLDQNVKHQFCWHNGQVVFPRFLEIFFPQNMHRKRVKAYYRHLKANILGSLKWGIIFYVGLWCGNQSGWSYYHVNWKLQYCEDFFGFGDLALCGNVSTSQHTENKITLTNIKFQSKRTQVSKSKTHTNFGNTVGPA